jgi:hypothetical protein
VEIKSSDNIGEKDAREIEMLGSALPKAERFILSRDPRHKRIGKTHALPWKKGIKELGL